MKPLWIVHTSESRKPLFDGYFMESFKSSGLSDVCDLLVYGFGRDTMFGQEAFNDGTQDRAIHLLQCCEQNEGRLIISSGDDIYFYGTASEILAEIDTALKYVDIVNMQDSEYSLCCCLTATRSSHAVRVFLRDWIRSRADLKDRTDDQDRYNYMIRKSGIAFGRLPLTFWTHGRFTGQRFIDDYSVVPDPPKDILVHHANYAMTTEVKIKLIEYVRQRVAELRK